MIRIVTDSASDITASQAEQLGISVIPIKVNFENAKYDMSKDEDFSQFYALLESSATLPSTSQVNPDQYVEHIELAKKAGDSIIFVSLSSGLSGTYQSGCIAKEMCGYPDVYIVDSKSAVVGQRLLVELAVKLRAEGSSVQEIVAVLEDAAPRVMLSGAVNTLKYLHKGGRIPKSVEIVGSIFNIKPIISVKDGVLGMTDKARGRAESIKSLYKLLDGIKPFDDSCPFYFGHTNDPAAAKEFEQSTRERYSLTRSATYPIGSTVGTHLGEGTIIFACLKAK